MFAIVFDSQSHCRTASGIPEKSNELALATRLMIAGIAAL